MVVGGNEVSLIYGFVARGTIFLAEYTEFTGNFPAIATQCLQKLPSSNSRFTYACDHHTFNFLLHNGYASCVVAQYCVGKQVSLSFLDRLKENFQKRYRGGRADTALAKSLNKEFGPVIKELMHYVTDHAEEMDKMQDVKAQVSEVKNIMLDNIEKATDRGENIKNLEAKTINLHAQAQDFKKQGTRIKRKMWYQNMKIKMTVLAILLILVLIIWVSVCQGFNCTKLNTTSLRMFCRMNWLSVSPIHPYILSVSAKCAFDCS